MRKNKAGKRTAAKRQTPVRSSSRTEKDCLQAPLKWAAQITKEVNACRQQKSKLDTALNKAKSELKTAEARVKAASKAKNSPAGKKELNAAKKAHAVILKSFTQLNKDAQQASKTLQGLNASQAKLLDLRKQLGKFETEWSKKPKAAAKPASKPKAKSRRTVTRAKIVPLQPLQETTPNPFTEELRLDETVETGS